MFSNEFLVVTNCITLALLAGFILYSLWASEYIKFLKSVIQQLQQKGD